MTELLVSVRSGEEAAIALEGGADVIDVKEPRRGALGAAEPEVWRAVLAVVGRRRTTSVALGELLHEPIEKFAREASGFDFAKIGLAGCRGLGNWQERWRGAAMQLPTGIMAVPVAYADWHKADSPAVEDVLQLAATVASKLLLIDTFDKSSGALTRHLSYAALETIGERAAECDVRLALAGSLMADDIREMLSLRPAYVGVRGAACRGGRDGAVDLARVKSLAAIVQIEIENRASRCLTTPRARRILPSR